MVTRVSTVAFEGIDARPVDVQVQIAPGNVAFMIVGLADKAVGELRERVRSALIASGLALPAKRITVNLAPATCRRRAVVKAVMARNNLVLAGGYCNSSGPSRCPGKQ